MEKHGLVPLHHAPADARSYLKLTPADVQAIRDAPAAPGVNVRLSRQYGVSRTHISWIRNGHTGWTRTAPRLRYREV